MKKVRHLHFVGIGGSGMSGIAEVLLNQGYQVSGSDKRGSEVTERLERLGATVYLGHKAQNVGAADVVVLSTAIKPPNEELDYAIEHKIPTIPRAQMLAELMRLKTGIAIAGSHGKTTTTSLVAEVIGSGSEDPTIISGGIVEAWGSNAKLGQGEIMVAEADESDGSFLFLAPIIAVVTNIDEEHLDYYSGLEQIKQAYLDFINKVPFYGAAILCLDDENIQSLLPQINKKYHTYGLTTQADLTARNINYKGLNSHFDVYYHGRKLGQIKLSIPGEYNVRNALAAIMVGLEFELEFAEIAKALSKFTGVNRRFQVRCDKSIMVVDDYAHHPTEIKALLKAARGYGDKRIIALFQPHRYSRTRDQMDEFYKAFYQADVLVLTDIYAASEQPIPGVTSKKIARMAKEHHHKAVHYCPTLEDASACLRDICQPGDMVLTIGAGSVWRAGVELCKWITKNEQNEKAD